MNTHAFGAAGKLIDIPKELSLKIVTELVREKIQWREWRFFKGLMLPKNAKELFGAKYERAYTPKKSMQYLHFLRDRIQDRVTFLSEKRDYEQDMANVYIAPLVLARTTIDKILSPDLFI